MKRVYFVRHGETDANKSDTEQNREGTLTELGTTQAQYVAKRFQSIPIDLIISSPYPRAQQTAEIINQIVNKQIDLSDLFVEYVVPSGIVRKTISDPDTLKIYKQLHANWHIGERHSDEETFADLNRRARSALEFLTQQKEENILVVTHGMFLRVLAAQMLLGEDMSSHQFEHVIYTLKTKNTGITLVEYKDTLLTKGDKPGWKLIAWNDHAHLGEIK